MDNRWTMRGMIDLEHELQVADEFWDFLGGEGTYIDLLNIFEKIGLELRPEIDEYFVQNMNLKLKSAPTLQLAGVVISN